MRNGVGDVPTITSDGGGSTATIAPIAENGSKIVTTIAVTDEDVPANTLNYSLGGTDAGKFTMSKNVLEFVATPDFELQNSFSVEVTVNDGKGGTDVQTLAVSVSDVNEAPVLTASNYSVAENIQSIETVSATDPDAGSKLTFSLSGADAGLLSIDKSTGALSFVSSNGADFETKNKYEVTVEVSDGALTDSEAITISVTDVFVPTVTSVDKFNAAENQTIAATIVGMDDEDGTVTYSLTGSGDDQAKFAIDSKSGVLSFKAAPNFEVPTDVGVNNTYVVEVQVADKDSNKSTQMVTVTVTDANDAPVITSNSGGASATISYAENGVVAVTTVTATDADLPANTLTYSVGGTDASSFAIDGETGKLTFVSSPNFESKSSYAITVSVDDGKSGTDSQDLTINITDVNEAPVVTSKGPFSVPENTTSVATILGSDPEGDKLTFSLSGGADKSFFTIDPSGKLAFASAPNFEGVHAPNYFVEVEVSDGSLTGKQLLEVTVTDVNDAPVANAGGAYSISEGDSLTLSAAGSVDEDKNPLTYLWDLNNDGKFGEFSGVAPVVTWSQLQALSPPVNDDGKFTVAVRVFDPSNASSDASVGLTIANTLPTANAGGPYTVVPGGSVVLSATASDPSSKDTSDGLIFLWDIDNDGNFNEIGIDATTATPTITPAQVAMLGLGLHTISLRVFDDTGATEVSTTLLVNSAPVAGDDTGAPFILNEGGSLSINGGAGVGFASTIDMDVGQTITVELVSPPAQHNGLFTLAADGAFTYVLASGNNFTGQDTFSYRLFDGFSYSNTAVVTLTVQNVNDAPTVANALVDQTVAEGALLTYVFPANAFADVDVGDTLTYGTSTLPPWLNFTPGTRTFTGTPPSGSVGTVEVTVTATDLSGAFISDAFEIEVTDGTAPTVSSITVGTFGNSRSRVLGMAVQFSESVTTTDFAGAFVVRERDSGTPVALNLGLSGISGSTVTLVFANNSTFVDSSGSLIDGNYELILDPTKVSDSTGNSLGGGNSGPFAGGDGGSFVFGDQVTDNFYRLAGDAAADLPGNGTSNGVVDFNDYDALIAAFFGEEGDLIYREDLDFDGNGAIDFDDYDTLVANFFGERDLGSF